MTNENEGQARKKQEEKKNVSTLSGVVCSNCGCSIAPVYKRVYVEELDRDIVKKVDETNLTEFIQASKSTTDLATLQKRFIELGEIPCANPNLGSVDTTVMPSDIHSLYNMVNDVHGNFNKLPESVRNVFGNNPQTYLAAILDGSYANMINAAFSQQNNNSTNETEKGE